MIAISKCKIVIYVNIRISVIVTIATIATNPNIISNPGLIVKSNYNRVINNLDYFIDSYIFFSIMIHIKDKKGLKYIKSMI